MRGSLRAWSPLLGLALGLGCTNGGDASGASAGLACIDTTDPAECFHRYDEGGCFVTGIGHYGDEDAHPGAGRADEDSFGGNAMGMKDGSVRGQWQNTTHLGDVFHGSATWLRCWKDSGEGPEVPRAIPNNAQWGGTGSWNHEEGYRFRVHAQDRAEGGHFRDYYAIEIYDAAWTLVYSDEGIIAGGNFQIHPPNGGHPYETSDGPEEGAPSELPDGYPGLDGAAPEGTPDAPVSSEYFAL